MAPTNQPSTRPTDCVEHEFIAYGELSELIGCQVCGRHPDDIISDLKTQLTAARERESQLVRAIEMLGVPVPLPKPELTAWLQSPAAESLREHVRRAIADEYATATPPSPEVGE